MTNEYRSILRSLAGVGTLFAGLLAFSPVTAAQSTATLTNPSTSATTSCTISSATIAWNGAISVTCSTDPTNLGSSTPATPSATITLSAPVGNLTTTGSSSATITANCASATGSCPGVAIQLAVTAPATGVTISGGGTFSFTAAGASTPFTVSSAGGIAAGTATLRLTVTAAGTGVTTTPAVANATGITASVGIVDNTVPPPTTKIGNNVALASAGGVATGSSQLSGYPIAAVNDGNRMGPTNGFWADGTASTFPDSVEVAFNGSKTLTRVVVYSVQDAYNNPVEPTDTQTFSLYGLTDFTVEGWNGTAWVNLATVTGNNLVARTVAVSFTTDRIRVNVTNAMAVYSRVVEVEAFDNSTTAPPSGGGGTPGVCTTSATFQQTASTLTNQYFFHSGVSPFTPLTGTQTASVAFSPVVDYQNGMPPKQGGSELIQAGSGVSRVMQHVISICPGDFSNANLAVAPGGSAVCSRFGVDGAGGISFHTATQNPLYIQQNSCGPLDPTKTYYVNARFVDPATNQTTCFDSGGYCSLIIGIQPQ